MLKPRPNSVHVSVKKKQKTNNTSKTPKAVGAFQGNATDIPMWYLFLKLLKSIHIPFTAAKHLLLSKYRAYFGGMPFPWFKVSLLTLGLYMVFQKDMNFQVNMKSPVPIVSDDRQTNNEPTAMAMSLPSLPNLAATSEVKKSAIGHINLTQPKVEAYVKRFSRIAVIEMQKYQVPASIKIGQGILASNAGENALAITHNNHFGVLCGQATTCANYESNIGSVKVKTYPSAWEGWRDHSVMLSQAPYQSLVKECGKDYKKWAAGIARLGYGNNQEYSQQLIELIETYQLYKLDEINEGM